MAKLFANRGDPDQTPHVSMLLSFQSSKRYSCVVFVACQIQKKKEFKPKAVYEGLSET